MGVASVLLLCLLRVRYAWERRQRARAADQAGGEGADAKEEGVEGTSPRVAVGGGFGFDGIEPGSSGQETDRPSTSRTAAGGLTARAAGSARAPITSLSPRLPRDTPRGTLLEPDFVIAARAATPRDQRLRPLPPDMEDAYGAALGMPTHAHTYRSAPTSVAQYQHHHGAATDRPMGRPGHVPHAEHGCRRAYAYHEACMGQIATVPGVPVSATTPGIVPMLPVRSPLPHPMPEHMQQLTPDASQYVRAASFREVAPPAMPMLAPGVDKYEQTTRMPQVAPYAMPHLIPDAQQYVPSPQTPHPSLCNEWPAHHVGTAQAEWPSPSSDAHGRVWPTPEVTPNSVRSRGSHRNPASPPSIVCQASAEPSQVVCDLDGEANDDWPDMASPDVPFPRKTLDAHTGTRDLFVHSRENNEQKQFL